MTKVIRGPRIAFPVRGPWRASSWVDKATGKHKLRFTRTTRRTVVVLVWPREKEGPADGTGKGQKGEEKEGPGYVSSPTRLG